MNTHPLPPSALSPSKLPSTVLLAFTLLHSSFILSPAAPPPELTILRQQYDKIVAERVTAPFEAGKAALDTKFSAALDNAIAAAKDAGDLQTVLAIQEDKKAIEAELDLPTDTDSTPASLKTLRTIYREQLGKLAEQRSANASALLTPYATKLQALEATLTKADRVDEAKEVMDYRTGLAQSGPLSPLSGAPPAAAATETAQGIPSEAPKVKGDDRRAAEWVLSLGGTVTLKQPLMDIQSAADLPKGKFEVFGIRLWNDQGKIPAIPDDAWSAIAGLQSLDSISCEAIKLGTPAFAHISACPALTQIQIQYSLLDDDLWPYLARLTKLKKLRLQYNDNLKGIGMSRALAPELETLSLSSRGITDAAMPEIAAFKNLQELSMDGVQVTDDGLSALTALPKLKYLNVISTPVSVQGLAKLEALPITRLGFGRTFSEMITQLPEVASIFPKLERLILPRDSNPTPEEVQVIAKALPGLLQIECRTHKCDDTGAAALAQLLKLEMLDLQYAPITDRGIGSFAPLKKLTTLRLVNAMATDAAFEHLVKFKSLKVLRLPKPGNGITADGLANFKKQRPDVKIE